MMDETYTDLIVGHLQGTLTSTEEEQFNILLENGRIDSSELKQLEKTYLEMGSLEAPELSSNSKLHGRFYSMLEEEKAAQSAKVTSLSTVWIQRLQHGFSQYKIGYAAAIFIAGLLAGNLFDLSGSQNQKIDNLTTEVYQMREIMMMTLLENDSSSDRLKAVNISSELPRTDDRVAKALLQTLNNDPNVNVRIAAVDALTNHASNPNVRSGMIDAITQQESPLVQIALADAMITLQENGAVDQFKKLLEQDDMNYNVRDKIEHTILALN
ncbi:MAG: HEAT repeat domain-containing protein [Balneolaceae bacterium]